MHQILKSRFLIAIALSIETIIANAHPLKVQACFLITALPQIYREFFATLWPAYAKKVRVELGPICAALFTISFMHSGAL